MCLTAEAMLLFLSLLPPQIVDVSHERIVVRAEVRDSVWAAKNEEWCTSAPRIDTVIRLKMGEGV